MMQPRVVGRYALFGEIAAGGMATVHFGRLLGAEGFSRVVAIKRLHPQFSRDPEFVAMFLDEARLVARIRSPNVVPILDVVSTDGELYLVMEYVHGEPLGNLIKISLRPGAAPLTPRIATSIMIGVLNGLHAAHEARSETGAPLGIVHRDVSPQNVLVGTDGVARVVDFGIAKASDRVQTTREGQVKGKMAYMAPEQILGQEATRQTDIYAAGIVLWELFTRRRLHEGTNAVATMRRILDERVPEPSSYVRNLSPHLDRVVARATERDPSLRYASARDMAAELEAIMPALSQTQLGDWVLRAAHDTLAPRQRSVDEVESSSLELPPEVRALREASALPSRAEPTSQASSISLSLSSPAGAGSRGRKLLPLVIASVLGAGISAAVVALLFVSRTKPESEPAASPPPATPAATAPTPEPEPERPPLIPPADPEEPPAELPTAPTASAEPESAPPVPRAAAAKPKPIPKRPPAPAQNPDYVFESRK